MFLILAIFGYFVFLHLLLIFLFAWGKHWKTLYQAVLLDSYALERVRRFFQTLQPVLMVLYRFVDQLKKKTGRPPIDYRFQLRFLLWWKFFEPVPLTTAVRRFNHSPELHQLLDAPPGSYTRFAMYRFLNKLQEHTLGQMGWSILMDFIRGRILDLSRLIVDSFPVYSFLNTTKCLYMAKFDPAVAKRLFKTLDLTCISQLFPKARGRAAPYADKVKCWIHEYLWDIPSAKKCHELVFGKEERKGILGIQKGWKVVNTYRNFLNQLKTLPNYEKIEQTVLDEIRRALRAQGTAIPKNGLQTMHDLRAVFHRSHRLKDPGISLATCTSKHQTFMGRGGLIAVSEVYEIPLLIQLTPKYKQSEISILKFFQTLHKRLLSLLKNALILGDAEFGTNAIQETVTQTLQAQARFENYGRSCTQTVLSKEEKRTHLTVERVIARINQNFALEHPRCLGPQAVTTHLHLAWLCDLLLIKYNLLRGNTAHPHSMLEIRG